MTLAIDSSQFTGKRNLLQLVQDACDELGLPRPAACAATTDATGRQMFALANRTVREIMDGHDGGEYWTALRVEYPFTTTPGTASYAMPADYGFIIPQTAWDRSYRWQLLGPLEAQEWQILKSGISPTGPRRRWRIFGGTVNIDPTPSDTATLVFEYQSRWITCTAAYAGQERWVNDSDYFLLADDIMVLGLKWRYLRAKGMDYAEEESQYNDALARQRSRQNSARILPLNAEGNTLRLLNNSNVPDTGFGA